MRQHILRLFIVLVLIVGISAVVFFFVKDNTPFVVSEYIITNQNKDKELQESITALGTKGNSKFTEDYAIYKMQNETSDYYASLLVNVNLSKKEAKEVKTLYSNYRKKANTLNSSIKSLINYTLLSNPNQTELEGRQLKVNNDFNALNKSYFNVVVHLENLVKNKIYKGQNYNVVGSLKSSLNMLINAYNQTRNNFSFVSKVNDNINALILNNSYASSDIVKFVIKFNELNKQTLTENFVTYFTNGAINNEMNILIGYLNSEVYYEEV